MTATVIHVAAAAIFGPDGRLLISRRPDHLHQGGLLEFPGGKVDLGETVAQALVRELQEELGITAESFQPLIRIPYDYPDKRVLLDVWVVSRYRGLPQGLEGQSLYWLAVDQLKAEQFPAANRPIITALTLPSQYLITGSADTTQQSLKQQWLARLDRALARGISMVQLRAHHLSDQAYQALTEAARGRCRAAGATLVLNRDPATVTELDADGLHLSRHQLGRIDAAALAPWRSRLIGASCHSAGELAQAQRLGVDYVLLSPVLPTASHPGAASLGWEGFAELAELATVPVYALGGMQPGMEAQAIERGGQGIAAIRAFWS